MPFRKLVSALPVLTSPAPVFKPTVLSFVKALVSWLELGEAGVVVAFDTCGAINGLALGNALLFMPVICFAI